MGMPIMSLRCIRCYSFCALQGSFLYVALFVVIGVLLRPLSQPCFMWSKSSTGFYGLDQKTRFFVLFFTLPLVSSLHMGLKS